MRKLTFVSFREAPFVPGLGNIPKTLQIGVVVKGNNKLASLFLEDGIITGKINNTEFGVPTTDVLMMVFAPAEAKVA